MYKLLLADDESDIRDGLMEVIHLRNTALQHTKQMMLPKQMIKMQKQQKKQMTQKQMLRQRQQRKLNKNE